eukprot:11179679-Lingulodinium_polyedra.AAC.1
MSAGGGRRGPAVPLPRERIGGSAEGPGQRGVGVFWPVRPPPTNRRVLAVVGLGAISVTGF